MCCCVCVLVSLPHGVMKTNTCRTLHECSCFIEFIKRVGERDKMLGLPSILSLFRNEFTKFNNTGARLSHDSNIT